MEHTENLQNIKQKLADAKSLVLETLDEQKHGMLRIELVTRLDKLINRLDFLNNVRTEGSPVHTFPPITNFMGEELKRPEPVKEETLSPEEQRKQDFINKIEALELVFLERDSEKILESAVLPDDELVLRGIAKRAGIEDFKTAKINLEFIDLIKAAMQENAKLQEKRNEAEEDLDDEE